MTPESLACPWCGSLDIYGNEMRINASPAYYQAYRACECGASGPSAEHSERELSRYKATVAWNARAVPASAVPEVSDGQVDAALKVYMGDFYHDFTLLDPELQENQRQDMRAALVAAFGKRS